MEVEEENGEALEEQEQQEKADAAAATAFDSLSALELIHCSHCNTPVAATAPAIAPATAASPVFTSILSPLHFPSSLAALSFPLAVVNAVAKFVI